MRMLISKFSPWDLETYYKSEHPEFVAIRNIILQNEDGNSFVLIGEGGKRLEHFKSNGIRFYNIPSNTKARFVLSIILKFGLTITLWPSVIVSMGTTNIIPFGVASTLTRARFIPVITGEIWYDLSHMPRPLKKIWAILLKASLNKAHAVLVLSENLKREVEINYKVNSSKIFVYRYKVSSIFNPNVPKSLRSILNPNGPIVLTVARISPQKGLIYLVEAARIVTSKIPNVKFVIKYSSSEKRYEEKIRDMIRNYNLKQYFTFIGKRPYWEIPKYMAAADVFVLPSVSEGSPVVILEALATGVPVVASRVGGVPDILMHEYNGVVTQPCDSKGLAEAIVKILSDEKFKKRLIEGGLATIKSIKENELEKMLNKLIFKDSKTKQSAYMCTKKA